MFKHALKLIWNRRRETRLVVVEIAAAFVITFLLTAFAAALTRSYHRPMGFDYENVLSVTVQKREAADIDGGEGGYSGVLADVLLALRALPRTEIVEPIRGAPYGASFGAFYSGLDVRTNQTTAEALQAIGVELVAGRWFGPEDEGQAYSAVLANRALAERAFGSTAGAVGQRLEVPNLRRASGTATIITTEEQLREILREVRIVGVIEEFRQGGEFFAWTSYVAIEHWSGEPGDERPGAGFTLMLKTVPGTDLGFGEQIVATVESVAPDWAASVTPWEQLRASQLRDFLLPFQAGALIAAFFIALVIMGLIGVLWQDVVRRTQEIGLRRALGAGAASVRRQIQLEALVIGAVGILIGAIIAIQFPLLNFNALVDWASSFLALALAAAAIMILVLLGALYPSWLASRREPADALRYE